MTPETQQFTVEARGAYIHLRTWGMPDVHHLDAPAQAALELAQKNNIEKLLDDISGIDSTGVSIAMQAESMGVLWKLRAFKKVAIVLKGSRLQQLFLSTVQTVGFGLDSKFRAFEYEAEAIEWLLEP